MEKRIAVVGAGPGGLFAALRAAELGLRVDLYEKGKIGCGIKCAEGFIDTLGVMGKPEAGVLFRVERFIFEAGREHHMHFHQNQNIWMIDRATWQKALARKAQALGVMIKEDFPITSERLQEFLGTYHYLIDASGAPSLTSRAHGFAPLYVKNASLLAQYEMEGDFRFLGDNTIKAVLEPDYFGYYYIFPKGHRSANVGVGRFHSSAKAQGPNLTRELDRVLRKEGLEQYKIRNAIHSFAPSSTLNQLVRGNILLVGDAAALGSRLHGGGIDMACISGQMAAECIAMNTVHDYPVRLWDLLGRKLTMDRRVWGIWNVCGYPFAQCLCKFPRVLRSIFFNRPPLQPILGFGGKKIF